MYIWGITKKYESLSWFENFMSGHLTIGDVTIYGENAMHWALEISTKKYGIICLTLPIKCFGRYWGCHIYFSPDGTPNSSTYYKSLWRENRIEYEIKAKLRKEVLGHNWKRTKQNETISYSINNYLDLYIWNTDVVYEKVKYHLNN